MTKTIVIDNKEYKIRASALVPRLYRYHFNRDIIQDMQRLEGQMKKVKEGGEQFGALDLEIFENVAWLFLKLGGEEAGNSPDEWLDSLEGMFSVYEALPEILKLWNENLETTAKPKKK